MKIARIVSSGTPGTESAALKAAAETGIATGGWKAKDSPSDEFGLSETPSTKKEQSTIWNIRDSHATLVIEPVGNYLHSNLAAEVAESYGRPVLVSGDIGEMISWLNRLGDELTLNIMGMDEEMFEGVERSSHRLIKKILNHCNADSAFWKGPILWE